MIQVNSLLTKFKRNDTMTMIVITLSSTPPVGLFRATTNKLNILKYTNSFKIPTGQKQTRWLCTRCSHGGQGIELRATENKPSKRQGEGLKSGTTRLPVQCPNHSTTLPLSHINDSYKIGQSTYTV